jgi:peptidoglycan hydrolase-like protein with peptidoglycan-binding domain
MRTVRRSTPLLAVLGALVLAPAAANAAEVPASTTPATTTPAAPAPAAGSVKLTLQRVGGRPLFATVGQRFVVRGVVIPYVAGQTVAVSFYLGGRKVAVKTVAVVPVGNGAGQFHLGYSSSQAGSLQMRADHYATAQQAAFSGRSVKLEVAHTNLGPGSAGSSVRLLQSELASLRYAVPVNGVYDEATEQAVIAFRKMTGQERIGYSGARVFKLLQGGAGAFPVRYRRDGRHVEANLTKQVLAEIEPGGRVYRIYTTSSGKPSTPTVIGRFTVYLKTPGTNSEGMVDSNYFIRGYAIHGYAEVPTYAASHGCLRVPIPDAPAIYGWVREGTPVDVYNEYGGGSARVRSNAGP